MLVRFHSCLLFRVAISCIQLHTWTIDSTWFYYSSIAQKCQRILNVKGLKRRQAPTTGADLWRSFAEFLTGHAWHSLHNLVQCWCILNEILDSGGYTKMYKVPGSLREFECKLQAVLSPPRTFLQSKIHCSVGFNVFKMFSPSLSNSFWSFCALIYLCFLRFLRIMRLLWLLVLHFSSLLPRLSESDTSGTRSGWAHRCTTAAIGSTGAACCKRKRKATYGNIRIIWPILWQYVPHDILIHLDSQDKTW